MKETNPFYGTDAWKRCRAAALRRDHGLCQYCLKAGRRTIDAKGMSFPVLATMVHHKKHLDEHPELALNLDNLVSLCDACHEREHPERHKETKSASGGAFDVPEVAKGIWVEKL